MFVIASTLQGQQVPGIAIETHGDYPGHRTALHGYVLVHMDALFAGPND